MKLKRDQLYGIVFLAVSVLLFWAISTIVPIIAVSAEDSGPKFFPTLLTIGFALCGVGLIVFPGVEDKIYIQGRQWIKVLKYFGLLMAYVIGMAFVGFRISTAIGLFVMINLLAEKRPPQWAVIAYSIAFSLIAHYAFNDLLQVNLPQGSLFY